ncbi:hypothetical protein OESDEN_18489 [Oesophagostomum dentatum]|uniref:Saposin B-type domain-containing protein n=1 Tax=Oesophagostomum dentatum TaxID=61180 RepID=A0A0B1SE45_OESDE|nr:hypothetical protein OESDEN_18489 [Oesophagostomum dentatum]
MLYSLAALLLCLDMTAAMLIFPRHIPPPGPGAFFEPFPIWSRNHGPPTWRLKHAISGDSLCNSLCDVMIEDLRSECEAGVFTTEEELVSVCEFKKLMYTDTSDDFCLNIVKKAKANPSILKSPNTPLLRRTIATFCEKICSL